MTVIAIVIGLVLLIQGWWLRSFALQMAYLRDKTPLSTRDGVAVVIAACNEERYLDECLTSLLKALRKKDQLIVVNDRSTDRTKEIIHARAGQDPRIKPVTIEHLPAGWLGKVHALDQGLKHAERTWVLFTDADVIFNHQTIDKAVGYAQQESLDFLTMIPEILAPHWLLQALESFLFHISVPYIGRHRIRDPDCSAYMGFGAFNLVRRSFLMQKSPGLAWLKLEVLDDVGLGKLLKQSGGKVDLLSGRDEVAVTWYESFSDLFRGLEKNVFSSLNYSWWRALLWVAAIYICFGIIINTLLSASAVSPFVALCLMFYLYGCYRGMSAFGFPGKTVLAFPLVAPLFPLIIMRATWRTLTKAGILWRGTHYPLSDLRTHQRVHVNEMHPIRDLFTRRNHEKVR